jgi:RHS repeat-associated protein
LSQSCTYDANGNTLSDASGKSYTWDFENRLTQAVVPGTNGGTTTFKYDPFGRRIQKSGPLGTTNYLYDGDGENVIEEVDNNGNILFRYVQGGLFDEPFSEVSSTTVSYYQRDGLDSVSSLSSSAGALANTYTYDSFGKLTASTGTITNPFQYTGRESDSETGLYYYRARYYDPTAGRFLSEDPLGVRDNLDMYVYVRNNPATYNDPFGLYQTIGFPPDKQAQLTNAISEALAKLNGGCPNCAGSDGPKIANAIQGATFVYNPKMNPKDCGETGLMSWAGLRHVVSLGPSAFMPICCSLASTVTHEAVHLRHGFDPKAKRIEKQCFGCGQ